MRRKKASIAKYTRLIPSKLTECTVYYVDPTFVKTHIKRNGTVVLGHIRKPHFRTKCD